jgi:UDP:flavonoid glycosyltransferase YjiC (YdhE family)
LYLAGTVPSFEYPRCDLPPQVHFVGPLLAPRSSDFVPPNWWSELEGTQPVVLVTQGTVATALEDLVIPALQALADEEVLVIGTTGGVKTEALSVPIPANARVETFIPFSYLLPYVDVMVTNGGFNGVQMALANGVPLLVAGRTEDKPEICARVAWSRVGIDLKTKSPRPDQIRQAVNKLLVDQRYKTRVKAFQTEMSQYRSSEIAVRLLEQLAVTKQPVLRP